MNLLFIGDLRNANNYGAFGTSRELINTVKTMVKDSDSIKFIDYDMIINKDNIIKSISTKKKKSRIKDFIHIIINRLGYTLIRNKKTLNYSVKNQFHIPTKFSDYLEFTEKVIKGDILKKEWELLEWADLILINGEGSIVRGTDKFGRYRIGGLYILYMAYLSKLVLHKKTIILNHTVDPDNYDIELIIKEIYPQLDQVYVRENLSQKYLSKLNIESLYFPDALFNYKEKSINDNSRIEGEYICLGDSAVLLNNTKFDIEFFYNELISKLEIGLSSKIIFIDGYGINRKILKNIADRNHIDIINYKTHSIDDLFYVLKGAKLFISGRWHASILSLLAETPILLWGSDSYKTRGLHDLYSNNFPFYDIKTLPNHIDDIVEDAKSIYCSEDLNDIKRITSEIVKKYNSIDFLKDYMYD